MKILCERPPKGRRSFISRGDEASVRRLKTGSHEGLVERIQIIGYGQRFVLFPFNVSYGGVHRFGILSNHAHYHLVKYLGLLFAHTLFPDHFVRPHELRLFGAGSRRMSALYSGFVPDENGVIERRKQFMELFYRTHFERKEGVVLEFDLRENRNNQEIAELAGRMEDAGITVPHPEANYHISNETTVFLEVQELRMDLALSAAHAFAKDVQQAITILGAIYAIALRQRDELDPDSGMLYASIKFEELHALFVRLFEMNDVLTMTFFGGLFWGFVF